MGALALAEREIGGSALDSFRGLQERLMGGEESKKPLHEVEGDLFQRLLELGRRLFQEHLDARGNGDAGEAVAREDGVLLNHKRESETTVRTVFGEVTVRAQGYGQRGEERIFPQREALELSSRSHSYNVQKMACREAVLGPYARVRETLATYTGARVGQQQAEELVRLGAADVERFYAQRALSEAPAQCPIVVVQADHKGIVMREADLREAAQKKALSRKLATRGSRGEKTNRKRMATVASVYEIEPHVRTAEDVLDELARKKSEDRRPKPVAKRVWASVERETEEVLAEAREEVTRRLGPDKTVVFLSDGERKLKSEAREVLGKTMMAAAVRLVMIVDLIHVIEYLWKAAHVFHPEGSLKGEAFVRKYLGLILEGKPGRVRAALAQLDGRRGLDKTRLKVVEQVRTYLRHNREGMRYGEYLAWGLPIATGVIEGACKTLVRDRFEITGARWGLKGAEALLALRSVYQSGDWEEYWDFHVHKEQERIHPKGHWTPVDAEKPELRLIKGGKPS